MVKIPYIIYDFQTYLKIKDFSIIYINPIKIFLRFCTDRKIKYMELTYENLAQFVLYLKDEGYTNGYLNNFIKAIRCFYNFLIETGKITDKKEEIQKILSVFKLLKVEQKIKDYITVKELEEIISQAITYSYAVSPERIKALLYFMFYTGIRRNELLNLKREDINLTKRQAIVRIPTKNKQENIVFYPQKVVDLLQVYFSLEEEDNNAFNMTSGKMMHFFNFLKNFNPEGKNITPHMFRHSFANMLARAGIDIRIAQKLLGHKSLASTMIYYNPDAKIVEEIYRRKIK